MASHRLVLLAALIVALLHAQSWAQGEPPPPPPPPGQPMPGQPNPVYPAPLAQETQSTYVPQSVALSGPEEIRDFDESRPIPMGYTPVERARRHLIVGGAVTLGVSYGISAFVAAIGEDASNDGSNEVGAMWIPVAGPWLQIANTDSATARVFLVGLGGAQVAGAIMLYYGMTTKNRVLVRNDLVGSLTVAPMAGNGASGMLLSGRF